MLKVFPVMQTAKGAPSFSDDFGAPRPNGRTHKGNDIFADRGTPVLAVEDGTLKFAPDVLGGNTATIDTIDKTHFYYAHLTGYEGDPRQVKAGEIIGYVGNTGKYASSTPTHLHFEMRLNGETVDPFPFLKAAPVVTERQRTVVEAMAAPTTNIGSAIKYVLFVAGGFTVGYAAWHFLRKNG